MDAVVGSLVDYDIVVFAVVAYLGYGCRDIAEIACHVRLTAHYKTIGDDRFKLGEPGPENCVFQSQFVIGLLQAEIVRNVLCPAPHGGHDDMKTLRQP